MLAYDYAGSLGHHCRPPGQPLPRPCPPFSTDAAIQAHIAAGVPPGQIILGLPLYGRAFENTTGLSQTYSGTGSGSWEGSTCPYSVLVLPRSGTEMYDATAGASYSCDSATKELISYDNVASVQKKVAYLQSKGLGGTMFWEASGSLDKTQNLLLYPNSKYHNIKKNLAA